MLNNQEFNELIEDMQSYDISMRVAALKDLIQDPSADPRVLAYLENLLSDTTPCAISRPYRFGEIRYLAAHALAAERAAMGINEPVLMNKVVRPLNTEELASAEKAAGIKGRGGVGGVLETFKLLRDMGHLPLVDLEL